MNVYAGIDIGTTNIKTAVFDGNGNQLAYYSVPNKIVHPLETWSEFDPAEVWKAVKICLKEVREQLEEDMRISSIGVSSLGESGVLLDKEGNALTNFIAWYDRRSKEEFCSLLYRIDSKKFFQITGQIPSEKYGLSKLMWQKKYAPMQYEKAKHWLSMEDYVLFCLTGRYATDYSMAARTMAFDIRKLQWSQEITQAADIDIELFPPAYPGGTVIGEILPDVAEQTGMDNGIRVCTGGHDHACAAVAVNIFEEGVVLDSMGTAEVSMVSADTIPEYDSTEFLKLFERHYSIYPHCGPRLYRILDC